MRRISTAAPSLLSLILLLIAASGRATAWEFETVDSGAGIGAYSSLVVGALDRAHIAYFADGSGYAKYAHFDGVQWLVETVDDQYLTGHHTSIALDSQGRPHISYARSGALIHAAGSSPTEILLAGDASSHPDRTTPVLNLLHPNPCRAFSIISFLLPRAAAVDLALYDVGGRRVQSLLDGAALRAGRHELEVGGASLHPGVYIARLEAAGQRSSRKLVVTP